MFQRKWRRNPIRARHTHLRVLCIINQKMMQKHEKVNDDLHRNVIAVIAFSRLSFFLYLVRSDRSGDE